MAKQIRDGKRRINLSLKSFWRSFRHPTLQEHIDVNYPTKWLLSGAIIGVGAEVSYLKMTLTLDTGFFTDRADFCGYRRKIFCGKVLSQVMFPEYPICRMVIQAVDQNMVDFSR